MSGIKDYSTTPSNNNASPPNGFPEGMAPASLNDGMRQVMADIRSWYQDPAWIDLGDVPTYSSGTVFLLSGDKTATYTVGTRIKATGTTPFTIYGAISAVSFSSPNTGVTVTWDSGSMDSTLNSVAINQFSKAGVFNSSALGLLAFNKISSLTTVTPATGDLLPFADISDSNNVKNATIGTILGLVSQGGRIVSVQSLTASSGTYTRGAGVTSAIVIMLGASGGSGGCNSSPTSGGAGGNSSFGSHVSVTGGAGGAGVSSGSDVGGRASDGAATGADISASVVLGGASVYDYLGGGQYTVSQEGGSGLIAFKFVATVGATESYTNGAAGTAGTGSVNGQAGKAGSIYVIELS